MLIFPAIDLRRGRCVRLRQGDPDAETIFDDDPVRVAERWVEMGAPWLHIVNLDGAIGDQQADAPNLRCLASIAQSVAVPIQFGGGLRTLEDIRQALDLGVSRVVLGTVAVQRPELVEAALQRFGPQRIVVGLDARGGMISTHGWQVDTDLTALSVARHFADIGVTRVVYTDIARDGMLSGVDRDGTVALALASGLQVIASGGVGGIEDIRSLLASHADGIEGVIVGQAIYTGALDLRQALALATQERP